MITQPPAGLRVTDFSRVDLERAERSDHLGVGFFYPTVPTSLAASSR